MSQKVARSTALVSVGESALTLGQLLSLFVLVRVQSKAEFADLSFLLLAYSTALTVGNFNLHQSLLFYFGAASPSRQRALAWQTTGVLGVSAVVCAVALLGLGFFGDRWGFSVGQRALWVALAVLLELPARPLSTLLLGAQRVRASALSNLASALLQTAALVVPPMLGWGVNGALRALALYAALRLLGHLAALRALFVGVAPEPIGWASVKAQLLYTLPLGLSMLTGMVNKQADKYLVAALMTPEDYATYVIGAWEVPLVTVAPYAVGAVLTARFVQGWQQGAKQELLALWLQAIEKISLLVVPATCWMLVCAEEIIALVAGEGYEGAVTPFRLFTAILLHRVAEYGVILRSAGDTRSIWASSLVLLVGNLALSALLTVWLGITGAALGTLLANIPAWIFVLTRIAKTLDVGLGGVFPWKKYGLTLLASLGAGLPLVALKLWGGWPAWALLLGGLPLFVAGFVAAGSAVGVVGPQERAALWGWARR